MDPLLANTVVPYRRRVKERRREDREFRRRRPSTLELWALTELPVYRLSLILSYAFAIWFGLSAFIAGVPTFVFTAPEGWTPIWAILIAVSGPVGLLGVAQDTRAFRKIELPASIVLTTGLVTYAGSALYLAYGTGDIARITFGAALAWLASGPLIRSGLLTAKVIIDHKTDKAKG